MISIDTELLAYLVFGLSVFALFLFGWNVLLHRRIARLLRGKSGKSLEGTINALGKEVEELDAFTKHMEEYLTGVEKRVRKSTQGIATVRFNPFKGTGAGGNQSFATAFVDERGDGVVISSLYSRDRVSIFAKPLVKFKSEYELTKEEKEAIAKARPS